MLDRPAGQELSQLIRNKDEKAIRVLAQDNKITTEALFEKIEINEEDGYIYRGTFFNFLIRYYLFDCIEYLIENNQVDKSLLSNPLHYFKLGLPDEAPEHPHVSTLDNLDELSRHGQYKIIYLLLHKNILHPEKLPTHFDFAPLLKEIVTVDDKELFYIFLSQAEKVLKSHREVSEEMRMLQRFYEMHYQPIIEKLAEFKFIEQDYTEDNIHLKLEEILEKELKNLKLWHSENLKQIKTILHQKIYELIKLLKKDYEKLFESTIDSCYKEYTDHFKYTSKDKLIDPDFQDQYFDQFREQLTLFFNKSGKLIFDEAYRETMIKAFKIEAIKGTLFHPLEFFVIMQPYIEEYEFFKQGFLSQAILEEQKSAGELLPPLYSLQIIIEKWENKSQLSVDEMKQLKSWGPLLSEKDDNFPRQRDDANKLQKKLHRILITDDRFWNSKIIKEVKEVKVIDKDIVSEKMPSEYIEHVHKLHSFMLFSNESKQRITLKEISKNCVPDQKQLELHKQLIVAIGSTNIKIKSIRNLLDQIIDINQAIEEETTLTPLLQACLYMETEYVKELLHQGANPNKVLEKDFDDGSLKLSAGTTPLIWCIQCDDSESLTIANILLDYKADVNAADRYGDTSLHWAAKTQSKDKIDFLIKRPDIDPTLKNKAGRIPREELSYAKNSIYTKSRQLLLQAEKNYKLPARVSIPSLGKC
jgi:hypothetical protein